VLIRGSFYEQEDEIRGYRTVAEEGREDSDMSSIDIVIERMQTDLDRLRPHL
jgi:hypothetical protein